MSALDDNDVIILFHELLDKYHRDHLDELLDIAEQEWEDDKFQRPI